VSESCSQLLCGSRKGSFERNKEARKAAEEEKNSSNMFAPATKSSSMASSLRHCEKFVILSIVILLNCIVGNLCAWQDNVRPKLFVQLGESRSIFHVAKATLSLAR
jgi:hypothetical protein